MAGKSWWSLPPGRRANLRSAGCQQHAPGRRSMAVRTGQPGWATDGPWASGADHVRLHLGPLLLLFPRVRDATFICDSGLRPRGHP